ncbi:MFS transporter [Eggerthella sinensis]|uniref:MFS transporter n=1 Tax=Eggerthella sinensis TaxID=242230 RepID=UPI001D085694|nr:MFS transporter [Eggerthella sinensis]MCB7038295.1 MFS transporter [Eggerthella sinensis]
MNGTKHKNRHYAWIVMIGCGLMISGSIGFFTVVAGSFYVPVSQSLGVEESTLAWYMTIVSLGQAISMPLAGRLVPRMNIPVHMTLICAVEALAGAAMAFYTDVSMWYVSGAVIGFCMGFNTSVGIAIILNNWFVRRAGFAIGMAWAIASVCNAIMSPIVTQVIGAIGWRAGYLALAAVSACIMLSSTVFLLRLSPADKGMKPYGYEEALAAGEGEGSAAETEGVDFRSAVRSPAFFALVGAMCLIVMTTVTNQLFPMYGSSVGFDPTVGSLMVSAAMLCDIAWNPLIGITCDKFGPAKAILLWACVTVVSFGCLLASPSSPALACLGAGLNDSMYAVFGTGMATLTMAIFGRKDYGRIYSLVPAIGYVVGSIGAPLLTAIYEQTGGFSSVWVFCIVCDVAIAVLAIVAMRSGRGLSWKRGEDAAVAERAPALEGGGAQGA